MGFSLWGIVSIASVVGIIFLGFTSSRVEALGL